MNHERLAQRDNTLFRARDRAFQHQEVVLDDAIVGEATHRRDSLLSRISLGRGVRLVVTLSDAVNLLVELRAVMVAIWVTSS